MALGSERSQVRSGRHHDDGIGDQMSPDEPVPNGGQRSDGGAADRSGAATASDSGPSSVSGPAVSSKSPRRSLFIGVVVAVIIVIAAVVGFIIVGSEAAAILSAGKGKATITWTPAMGNGNSIGNPPQTFTGTINGNSVSGISTLAISASSAKSLLNPTKSKGSIQVFKWKGTFGGKPFDLGMFIKYPLSLATGSGSFVVKGTYGDNAVNAIVGPPRPYASGQLIPPTPFHGTIGQWKVTGVISGPTGTRQVQTATATFTVSK